MSFHDYIYPIIVPSDFNVEDAFSSTNTPGYSPASPGNTPPDSSDDLTKDLLASLAISHFHDDPYMKVMQAYNATSNESPIPLRVPIAPPTILPLSLVLPLSPMFDPQDFFLPEEILPPHKRARSRSSSFTSALPQNMEDKIKGLGNGRVIIQRDFDQLETKLQEARTQISRFQKEQIRHDDEIVLARVRTSTLEILIEDIQIRHRSNMKSLLDKIFLDSVSAALKAQAATIANTDNTNTGPREAPVARNNYTEDSKVKFATGTLTGEALSWWNSFAQPIGIEEAYKITWFEFKTLLTPNRILCPTMVPNSEKLMEVFIGGLPRSIEGNVTASKPQTLEEAITITQRLMDQVTKHNSMQGTNDHKRKFDDRRTFTNNNYQNIRNNNNNRNNDYQQQQTKNIQQETYRAYACTAPTENKGYSW
ncbi:hypothetical protein Tco_0155614 [Tanacetum coccineum]